MRWARSHNLILRSMQRIKGGSATGEAAANEVAPVAGPPTWTKWSEIGSVVLYPSYLKKTLRIALIVGTILFLINHLDEVLRGQATYAVWIKGAATYLVPFAVANMGVLIAARRQSRA